jgi:micrococcal nuclease
MRFILILLLLCVPVSVRAEKSATTTPVITGDFKELKHTGSTRIDKVIDAKTILLKDGKIISLLGLGYPFMAGGDIVGSTVAAKERLEQDFPEGTDVMLYQTRNQKTGRSDRMGHVLAHLVRKKDSEWLNGLLVSEGYAYAVTTYSNPDMAEQLYTLEDKARADKKGIWMDLSPYGLLTAETASQGDGNFRVVEGSVIKSALSHNNLYLNFGNDYRKDFTVMISPPLRKALSRKGIDPMSLSGQKVRVRGWIREWNGPYMELETVERMEIIPAPSNVIPNEVEGSGLTGDPSTPPMAPAGMTDTQATGQLNP